MTRAKKLFVCLTAAGISGAGATILALPAAAAMAPCSAFEMAYAQGYAAGACGGTGTVLSCDSDGRQISFSYICG